MSLEARTSIATAVAAREVSDLARGIAVEVARGYETGSLIARVRAMRVAQIAVQDRAVLAERAQGATWEEIADALQAPVADVVRRYAGVADEWAAHGLRSIQLPDAHDGVRIGILNDTDPEGTATAVELWIERHTEPWDERVTSTLSARLG